MGSELAMLGPLAFLAGTWEGDKGIDIAPGADISSVKTSYREKMVFEPAGPVMNHDQQLFGLRYSTTAWRIGKENPFHEELGYWLWDAEACEVMRCFMVPRGVVILAVGRTTADAREFSMTADAGSSVAGILSNPYLDRQFRSEHYELKVEHRLDGSLFYEEETILRIPAMKAPFHHRDSNILSRTSK